MNDITKARYFLQAKGSKLKDLDSFGLMLATASSKYRDIKLRLMSGIAGDPDAPDALEIDALIDYALLKYLKINNQLPDNVGDVIKASTSLVEKREIALRWAQIN